MKTLEIDLEKYSASGLSFTEFVFITAMYKQLNQVVEDILIENARITVELEELGYLKKTSTSLVLREKGLSLLSASKSQTKNDVKDWIEDWRNIFPSGRNNIGFLYRGSKSGCIDKMSKFVKKNPKYSKEQIFEATKKYVERFRAKGYVYMLQAHYFIQKQQVGSTLEAELEVLGETKLKNTTKSYGENELTLPSKLDNSKPSSR